MNLIVLILFFFKTPFEPYLDLMREKVSYLKNISGIAKWLRFDGSIDINEATDLIIAWTKLREWKTMIVIPEEQILLTAETMTQMIDG